MAAASNPCVTVLMAVHDGAHHLRAAVSSILQQTLADFELLIINDGSADASEAILTQLAQEDMRIRVVHQARSGLTASLNRGLQLARGIYVARMDADDVAHLERLSKQVSFLEANPDVVAVGCQVTLTDDLGRPIGPLVLPLLHEEIDAAHISGLAGRIIHPAVMIRSSSLHRLGGYRVQFSTSQDYDLWLRLAEVGRLANLPDSLLEFRQHSRSVSSQRRQQQARDVMDIWIEARRRRGLEVPPSLPPAQSGWLAGSDHDSREWWVTLAIANGHFPTAWAHALALVRHNPRRSHYWWVLHRVVRMWLKSTAPGSALARLLRR